MASRGGALSAGASYSFVPVVRTVVTAPLSTGAVVPAPGVVVPSAGASFAPEIPKGMQRRGGGQNAPVTPHLGSALLDAQLDARAIEQRVAVDRLLWIVVGAFAGWKLAPGLPGLVAGGFAGHLVAERIARGSP